VPVTNAHEGLDYAYQMRVERPLAKHSPGDLRPPALLATPEAFFYAFFSKPAWFFMRFSCAPRYYDSMQTSQGS
jgi:hypothetical protein